VISVAVEARTGTNAPSLIEDIKRSSGAAARNTSQNASSMSPSWLMGIAAFRVARIPCRVDLTVRP
jgi:hypothetical protein